MVKFHLLQKSYFFSKFFGVLLEARLKAERVALEERMNFEVERLRIELQIVIENLSKEKSRLKDDLLERDIRLAEYRLGENFILGNKITIHQKPTFDSKLHLLSEEFGSDKGGDPSKPHPYPHKTHNYVDAYEFLFSTLRIPVQNLFECGIGTNNTAVESNMGAGGIPGASLRMWARYFPNAKIYGADIDESILFTETRIQTFQMDQTSKLSIENFLQAVNFQNFDVIIDDGLHNFQANTCLFDNLIEYLNPGGVYIIEDVAFQEIDRYKSLSLQSGLELSVMMLERENTDLGDNSLIVIRKALF